MGIWLIFYFGAGIWKVSNAAAGSVITTIVKDSNFINNLRGNKDLLASVAIINFQD